MTNVGSAVVAQGLSALNRWLTRLLVTAAVLSGGAAALAQAVPPDGVRVIRFSGYDWEVRPAGVDGPGPNQWDPHGVWVDKQGRLHLKLTRRGGVWRCAEVSTRRRFGFGRYQFQVTGVLDRLDRNIVLGLFNYPSLGMGPDGTNEIDIEYSRWGDPAALPASETIYPAHLGPASVSHLFAMPQGLSDTTQRFDWQSREVRFQCLRGHRDDDRGEYARWAFRPVDSRQRIPQQPLPVHINLWLVQGKAPHDGQEVEVVVKRFTFSPTA